MLTNESFGPGVEKPMIPGVCWALVRLYTGSAFPGYGQCSKNARPGKLTCHWHRDREDEAQKLKE